MGRFEITFVWREEGEKEGDKNIKEIKQREREKRKEIGEKGKNILIRNNQEYTQAILVCRIGATDLKS